MLNAGYRNAAKIILHSFFHLFFRNKFNGLLYLFKHFEVSVVMLRYVLAERCNCIAKFYCCHNNVVCLSSSVTRVYCLCDKND